MAQSIRVLLNADLNKGKTSLPTYGFTQDTAECATFNLPGANAGYSQNNHIAGTVNPPANGGYSTLYSSTNFGLVERAKLLNYQADGAVQLSANITNVNRSLSLYAPAYAANSMVTTGMAIIPLKYLSDFFSENNLGMPLHNLRMYLQINVNQGSFTFTAVNNTTTLSTFPYQTIPIVVTDVGALNMSGASSVITLQIGQYNGTTMPTRLYYPTVQLEASTLSKMTFPLRKSVTYRDLQYFTLTNVAANSNFNWQISNAIPGLKRLFILPALAASTLQTRTPSWGNGVSSTPGTTDPFVALSNISLQINTRQMWSNNVLYDYEAFIEQILPNRLNGDTSDFMAGSLISEQQWLSCYRWYVFDCSKVPSLLNVTANTPVNVQLLATNNTAVIMDLFCWAEVETDVVLESTPITTYVQ